jgi:hypothetical protein
MMKIRDPSAVSRESREARSEAERFEPFPCGALRRVGTRG